MARARARAARRPTWHPVKGRRTVEIRHPGGHHEERRIPRAHHSRAGRAVTPLSEGRRSDGVRLSVRGARVSVTARIEALRTGGGRLGGAALTTCTDPWSTRRRCRVGFTTVNEAYGTGAGRLRGATLACTELVQSKSRSAVGRQLCSSTARVCRSGACCCNQPGCRVPLRELPPS